MATNQGGRKGHVGCKSIVPVKMRWIPSIVIHSVILSISLSLSLSRSVSPSLDLCIYTCMYVCLYERMDVCLY